ncbi:MAG: gamma-glutamyltransferase [Pseudomonadales bacterium]|nr:gamma-glutamyltransferase [Pseudomonadales bacterium]
MRLFLLFILCLSTPLYAIGPEATYGEHAMVTSRSKLASEAGLEIMRAGGNAVDGAVATAFALAVTYPSAGNIGGGGFAVVRLKDGTVVTLDHRETAPASAHRDMYLNVEGEVVKGLSTASHKAAGTPVSVDGLLVLLEAHGSMSRQEVLAPAIRLATKGFPLSFSMARAFKSQLKKMAAYPASMDKFSNKGKPYEQGDIWRQPLLAATLKKISKHGRDGFYKGKVAALIASEMKRTNGEISLEDLANYKSMWREPVHGSYRGYEVYGMAPPSSGGALVQQILNMIEPYDIGLMGFGSSQAIHLMIEAERRAYADRAEHLGDPDHWDVPTVMLINKQYAKQRFADYDPLKASKSEDIGSGNWPEESKETTHFSVYKNGMMVALTTTLNSSYGSKIVVPGTGILLNNEMDDFSIKPNTPNQFGVTGGKANAIAPGKRMLSSMSPTLVTKDGEPFLITGSPGGSTIITTTLQIILNVIDHNMGIDDAVSQPRFHHQWLPNVVTYDKYAFSPDTLNNLKLMGHVGFRPSWGRGMGDANSILIKEGVISGTKDPRYEGGVVAY